MKLKKGFEIRLLNIEADVNDFGLHSIKIKSGDNEVIVTDFKIDRDTPISLTLNYAEVTINDEVMFNLYDLVDILSSVDKTEFYCNLDDDDYFEVGNYEWYLAIDDDYYEDEVEPFNEESFTTIKGVL